MSGSAPREWETIARREVTDLRPWVRLWAEDVRLPDGRVVEGFASIEMPDYAVVVALTPGGDVIVEHNYKHGPRRVCLNLPAGYLEPGEDPLAAAQRELLEETGYAASEWVPLGRFATDGNRGCGTGFFFLARGARQVANPDAGDLEELTIGLLPLGELAEAARRGEVAVLSIAAAIGLAVVAQQEG
ncbi:MAG: ADP-ribose pyrophosphatase [uncultured Thermomicrobiales bacterium]|uniref:ADP-ribose pyrophosphatase n=1 Tax=uncultured Thermomicrobiales bacterium TaxID=1645740 RepID=A0A6J4UK81_9BACT|nr:MAG: ADP-ribose pyrophosphatase [uncultured Thermomicrobiales bacterium]